MSQARVERVVLVICKAFSVDRGALGTRRGQQTPRAVRFARGACGLLARKSAGVSISAMGRFIGYQGKYLLTLTRKHRTLLRWARWPNPPQKSGAIEFREKFQRICLELGVNIEELSEDP